MAIGYRGRAQVGSGTTTATVVQANFDVAPQSGDLLVAFASGHGSPDAGTGSRITTPTGWTPETVTDNGDGSGFDQGSLHIFTKLWTSGDTAYTFNNPDAGGAGVTVEIIALSGVDTTTPNAGTATTGGTGTAQTIPSVTAADVNCWLLAAAATWGTTTAYSSTGTMTQRGTASESGGAFTRSVAATEALTALGATGTRTFTAGAAGTYYASAAIAIRPFVVVVPPATTPQLGSGGTRSTLAAPTRAQLDDDLLLL